MADLWHSLYVSVDSKYPNAAAVSAAVAAAHETLGYQRYDPFAGGMGTPLGLKSFVKLFVAPVLDGWIRVIGEPDSALPASLSTDAAVIDAWLNETDSRMDVYINGMRTEKGLITYLAKGKSPDDLARAERGFMPVIVDRIPSNRTADLLPEEFARLAQDNNVNPDQANKMIQRLTGQLFGKLDRQSGGEASAMQDQARGLIAGTRGIDWNSAPAQRLKAMASVLILPDNWRDPDFDTVRDAYQVARRLKRSPSAQLMPDEQAAIRALPNAGEYEAVYVGR